MLLEGGFELDPGLLLGLPKPSREMSGISSIGDTSSSSGFWLLILCQYIFNAMKARLENIGAK